MDRTGLRTEERRVGHARQRPTAPFRAVPGIDRHDAAAIAGNEEPLTGMVDVQPVRSSTRQPPACPLAERRKVRDEDQRWLPDGAEHVLLCGVEHAPAWA